MYNNFEICIFLYLKYVTYPAAYPVEPTKSVGLRLVSCLAGNQDKKIIKINGLFFNFNFIEFSLQRGGGHRFLKIVDSTTFTPVHLQIYKK